ncbi:hypothetical protein M0R45_017103 [Rubus argutus]|uniref:Non-haem dioxygenase N-terminal domain-containing protein n=1 Tax=Rubus argutus TaxID=59490 RepID=A0AAW1XTZ6_RUBAR
MLVDCSGTRLQHPSPLNQTKNENERTPLVFNAPVLQYEANIPSQFIWPYHEKPCPKRFEVLVPPIDLKGFLMGDASVISEAIRSVDEVCKKHGFFLIVSHGVDAQLIAKVHDRIHGCLLWHEAREEVKGSEKGW